MGKNRILLQFKLTKYLLQIPSNILIMDRPAFKHRGIFVDTSRNFYPVAAIKRTIDAMSLSKLNIFHWRMTGKHSFAFEFQSHPEMTQFGAYTPQKVYSQRDIEEVVEFARNRGISVIPEIDAPSNVGVAWRRMNLMACWNAKPWTKFCSEPPCGQLDPTKAKVYNVLSSLYEETIELFDYPKLFHMGGHGVSSACWRNSSRIVKWMTRRGWGQTESDFMKLWIYFQENALKQFDDNRHNKTPVIIWSSRLTEEVNSLRALDNNRYIVQWQGSSRDQKAIKTLLAQNFRVIVSNSDALHLDCGLGNWISDHPHWCSPFSGWQRIYDNRLENLVGGGMANNLILGAEAVLLSHQTDQHSIDARLWPRVSALAERLWTNPKWDWKGAEQRMINHRHELVANGIAAETLVPEWCRKNPGNCAGQSLY